LVTKGWNNQAILYLMGHFTLANNQNMPIGMKFPTDTVSCMRIMEEAVEVSQKVTK
jgi:hypothetical protein